MTAAEVAACAHKAVGAGCTGIILQSADDDFDPVSIGDMIRQIKKKAPAEVTLRLGMRDDDVLREWRAAGADRYLLTLDGRERASGVKRLQKLAGLGLAAASEILIGAGDTAQIVASKIQDMERAGLDLVSISPDPLQPAPGIVELVYRSIALFRRFCPRAHILTTPALDELNPPNGRELSLGRGANMLLADVAPPKYRKLRGLAGSGSRVESLRARLRAVGRRIAIAPGRPSATRFL
jgi:biotin synthase